MIAQGKGDLFTGGVSPPPLALVCYAIQNPARSLFLLQTTSLLPRWDAGPLVGSP
jgi:hypothetical protein